MLLNAPEDSPHFYIVGPRAPAGGAGPTGASEQVACLIYRDKRDLNGEPLPAEEVLLEDEPFPGAETTGPLRFESEIAIFKPEPDVVVLGTLADTGLPFGQIEIRRANAPLPGNIELRTYNWLDKYDGPRLDDAGDLDTFVPNGQKLPAQFLNSYHNGNPVPNQALFSEGDQIVFDPNVGSDASVTIPAPPGLSVTIDDRPADPPVEMTPFVDTVIYDQPVGEFTLLWRAVTPWEDRLELATLEVTPNG